MTGQPNLDNKLVTLMEAAAGRLEGSGWQRGGLGYRTGPNCLAGALWWEASTLTDSQHDAARLYQRGMELIETLIPRQPGTSYLQVPRWNDHECRDAAEAAAKLREAAKEAANNTKMAG